MDNNHIALNLSDPTRGAIAGEQGMTNNGSPGFSYIDRWGLKRAHALKGAPDSGLSVSVRSEYRTLTEKVIVFLEERPGGICANDGISMQHSFCRPSGPI